MSILNGEGAKTEYTGISFAGKGQNLDTGFKVIHNSPNTSSLINSKSISKNGGAATYRALVRINENSKNSKCSVSCESLMLDDISRSDTIPVWAIFETLALGEFGTLYDCACTNVKLYVSNIMKLPTNLDSDGMNTKFFIFTVKDLRNAIAHNNVIFDTRFKTGKIDQRLVTLLETEVGISNIDFKYMDAYIIMITYFLRKMGETKTACKQFVASYQQQTEYLRNELPINIYNQVVGTQHRPNMNALQKFISKS